VSESGIASREDVERVTASGAKAVLVGESLMLADDPAAACRRLLGK
jgi:indole-3-glycerol phosphate synthase